MFSLQNIAAQDTYWVSFKDKGGDAIIQMENPSSFLPSNVIERRYLFALPITTTDLPVSQTYLEKVTAIGASTTKVSKWLNGALFVSNNPDFLKELSALPFIQNVQVLTSNKQLNTKDKLAGKVINTRCVNGDPIYGCAYTAIDMLQGQFLHQNGYNASTIDIGVMDNGFHLVNTNRFFDSLNIQNKIHGVYNYVEETTNVFSVGDHGAQVMSTMAANIQDTLLGTAPEAHYYLFTTEDNDREGLAEEINWTLAAEWAEANLGNWIVLTTSLSYSNGFNDASSNHSYSDMDGNTTIITKAADLAASKGLLVINSAGNEGEESWRYVAAPADGDSVLTIGAVDSLEVPTAFSSYGPSADGRTKPNVSALGRRVVVAKHDGTLAYANGTSFSCPIVAGLTACLWEAFPQKNNMEIIKAIEQSAHLYYAPEEQLGFGIPNFFKAFEILSLSNSNQGEELNVFPNPVEGYLNIFFLNNNNESYQLIVSDMSGKIWFEEQHKANSIEQAIEVQDLPKGVYSVFVKQGKNKWEKKIIKK